MKRLLFFIGFLCFLSATVLAGGKKSSIYKKGWIDFNKDNVKEVYEDPQAPLESRVADLLGRMTLEEKVGQLLAEFGWPLYSRTGEIISLTDAATKTIVEHGTGTLWGFMRADPWTQKTLRNGLNTRYAIEATNMLQHFCIEKTRLGIPVLLAEECPHGHMAIGATSFPTSIGLASTWNPELMKQIGEAEAMELRKQGAQIGYGPVLDLARDPRWSRVEEGFGEDPFLVGIMGSAIIKGQQDNASFPIVSTVKHFTAYGWTEGGHNGGSAHIGPTELQEMILPPFRRAVNSGLRSIMTSYNDVDGEPCTGSRHLLTDILKKEWGFQGFVVSDLYSIDGMVGCGAAASLSDAALRAADAGVEMDLGGQAFRHLTALVRDGKISEQVVDEAVKKILSVKFLYKLFDSPFLTMEQQLTEQEKASHQALAAEAARQSIVLLKNNGILPLKKDIRSIAVIGPNSDAPYNQLGDYTAPQEPGKVMTVLEGIRKAVSPSTAVNYARGCAVKDTSSADFNDAREAAMKSDVVVLVMGGSSARDFSAEFEATGAAKTGNNQVSDMENGEGNDRCTLELLGRQKELVKMIKATGKPMVVVLIEGRPLTVGEENQMADAMLNAWYPGVQGGRAVADVIFGDYNPSGRLPISIPKSVGALPSFYNTSRGQNRGNYVEGDAKPLYPFGFGLSYTTFHYDNLEVSNHDSALVAKVALTNSGSRAGDEVVQIYVRDVVTSHVTPDRQLKAFQRVHLNAGESKTVELQIDKNDLKLYKNGSWQLEPGEFAILAGSSSNDLPLMSRIIL